ncbi:hypothetical protein D3C77_460960 [compost metagenome]
MLGLKPSPVTCNPTSIRALAVPSAYLLPVTICPIFPANTGNVSLPEAGTPLPVIAAATWVFPLLADVKSSFIAATVFPFDVVSKDDNGPKELFAAAAALLALFAVFCAAAAAVFAALAVVWAACAALMT